MKMKTVDILRKAKAIYESGRYNGMCACIRHAVGDEITSYQFHDWSEKNIPLFSFNVAAKRFGATGLPGFYWWSEWDEDSRIDYFDWLIEQYKDK